MPPKPTVRGNGSHAGDSPDPLPVRQRQQLRERDAVAGYQALRGLGAERVDVKSPPDCHHQSQQQERERDAQDS